MLSVLSKIIACIVNDPVGTERAYQFNILRAANSGYVGPK
jgi:hypothetical protein